MSINFKDLKQLCHPNRCDLRGQPLRISVMDVRPYCSIKFNERGRIEFDGYSIEIEILKILAGYFNFGIYLKSRPNDVNHINGTMDGLTRQVLNGDIDIGICMVRPHHNFGKLVEFSVWYIFDEMVMVSQRPKITGAKMIMIRIMTLHVWLLLISSFTFVAFLLYLRGKFSMFPKERKNLIQSILVLWQITLGKNSNCLDSSTISWSYRILIIFWTFAMLIFIQILSGRLYSLMHVHTFENYIDYIEDLEQSALDDSRPIIIQDDTYFNQVFAPHKERDLFGDILKHMERHSQSSILSTMEEVFNRMENDKYSVFITIENRMIYQSFMQAKTPMHIGKERIAIDFYSMIFPKDSPLIPSFNRLLDRIRSTGLAKHLRNQLFTMSSLGSYRKKYRNDLDADGEDNKYKGMNLDDLQTMFTLYLILILSVNLIFLLELLIGKFFEKTTGKPKI